MTSPTSRILPVVSSGMVDPHGAQRNVSQDSDGQASGSGRVQPASSNQENPAAPMQRSVVILGATGSIGRSTLEVLRAEPSRWRVFALSGHGKLALLAEQAHEFRPRYVVATNPVAAKDFPASALPTGTELLVGEDAACRVAAAAEVEIVVSAMVGSVGLHATWAALEAGKRVCLANKETLVTGGPAVTELIRERPDLLLPVDSEHSAIHQCLLAGKRAELRRVILTASGGPFRDFKPAELEQVTLEQALQHPTWNMGPKITIDSATLMNKALEIIEARWLFQLQPGEIDVVIHPQSVVHSLVEFVDGSCVAQLSPPDMKLPIQYALTYPHRVVGPAAKLDFRKAFSLDFLPADPERYPALGLGLEVAQMGGTAGAVLNAANEVAVARFRESRLGFSEIVPACREILQAHHFERQPTLAAIWNADRWARQETQRWKSKCC